MIAHLRQLLKEGRVYLAVDHEPLEPVLEALLDVAEAAQVVAAQNSESASPALQRSLSKLDFKLDALDIEPVDTDSFSGGAA